MFGKPSTLVFRKNDPAVPDDVENAVVALDQLSVDVQISQDRGRQTGGLRKVVSAHAISNGNGHLVLRQCSGFAPTPFDGGWSSLSPQIAMPATVAGDEKFALAAG